jgi:hypothetical protein
VDCLSATMKWGLICPPAKHASCSPRLASYIPQLRPSHLQPMTSTQFWKQHSHKQLSVRHRLTRVSIRAKQLSQLQPHPQHSYLPEIVLCVHITHHKKCPVYCPPAQLDGQCSHAHQNNSLAAAITTDWARGRTCEGNGSGNVNLS